MVIERRRSHSDADPAAMLPVDVFSSKQFTAINVVTFVMYGAMSVVFFLLVLTLQVVAGFNPIAAGTAMLPVTVLMLLFSARSGALAQRIGPRLPITIGVLLAAAGMLLMTRVGVHTSYLRDVLPAAMVFGLGLTLAVAPLTATVLATADERHAGVASGVNNAVARAAGLLGVAAIPPLAGLTGAAYTNPPDFAHGFHLAIVTCAVLMVAAAALAFFTVRDDALRTAPASCEPECRTFSAVASPRWNPTITPRPKASPHDRARTDRHPGHRRRPPAFRDQPRRYPRRPHRLRGPRRPAHLLPHRDR
nr:MFS transporter [Nocardia tengchongensis]